MQPHKLDLIKLTALKAWGYHGVLPEEKSNGQNFFIDLTLHLNIAVAAETDDLAKTVNYAELADSVVNYVGNGSLDLIETLTSRIADLVLVNYPSVERVEVTVHKPEAPIPHPFQDVSITVLRDRAEMEETEEAIPNVLPEAVPGYGGDADTPLDREQLAKESSSGNSAVQTALELHPELLALPTSPVEAVVALGANLGDPTATLQSAVRALSQLAGVQVLSVGPLAKTQAVGGPSQEDFFNTVVLLETTLSAHQLLSQLHFIEAAHGRVREVHWGPRTLDLDLIVYGGVVAEDEILTIPHPRANDRAFVLIPWREMNPSAVLPGLGGGSVSKLADTASDSDGIRWLSLDWFQDAVPPSIDVSRGADQEGWAQDEAN